MRLPVYSPDRFAAEFNAAVPCACQKIDAQDIQDLTKCGLIGRYSYYGRADLETVRAILLYEQLRAEREREACLKDVPRTCKRCGKSLCSQSNGRRGRPNEYCQQCESYRNRERYINWKVKHASVASS